jgi:hypothetical protein
MKTKNNNMQINKQSVLVGSDFEMFLVNEEGKAISAIPFIGAGKKFPEKTAKDGCCIQHDGVLAECNVPPVCLGEAKLFWENIQYVKNYIEEKFAKKQNLTLTCCPSMELEPDQLDHPEALQSGCEPTYNAWMDGQMNSPCDFGDSKLRTAGGHIHLSFENCNEQVAIDLMKCFDLFLTIPCIFMDDDDRRRTFYGKAGEMRLCEWNNARGFEARTLSNFWVEDEELVEFVFGQLDKMFDYYNEHGIQRVNELADEIVGAINNSDKDLAGKLCDEFGLLLLLKEQTWDS